VTRFPKRVPYVSRPRPEEALAQEILAKEPAMVDIMTEITRMHEKGATKRGSRDG